MTPTPKYKSDPFSNVPLRWNVHPEGYPIRPGDAPAMIEKDRLAQAGFNFDACAKVLKIPDQMDEYIKIIDWIASGAAVLRFEDRIPDQATGTWTVFVCWLNINGTIPKGENLLV